jgi:hypothetical protein
MNRRSIHEDERPRPQVDDREVKRLAGKYRLTPGQIRGLIARYGTDAAGMQFGDRDPSGFDKTPDILSSSLLEGAAVRSSLSGWRTRSSRRAEYRARRRLKGLPAITATTCSDRRRGIGHP